MGSYAHYSLCYPREDSMYYILSQPDNFNAHYLLVGKMKNIKAEYNSLKEAENDLKELNRYSLKRFRISQDDSGIKRKDLSCKKQYW